MTTQLRPGVSFREAPSYSYKATMEPFLATQEEATWSHVGAPFRESTTNACTPTHAAKLTAQHRIGPWKTLKVGKGDKITVRAQGLYASTAPVNSTVNWGVYVHNMSGPTGAESGNSKSLLTVGLSVSPFSNSGSNAIPKAYLQYVLTAKDNSVTRSERKLLTAGPGTCEALAMSYKAESDGYLQVLVANESDKDVWFDQVEVSVEPALIVQEQHYDPFGLVLSGIDKGGDPQHAYLYNQSSEKQQDVLGEGYGYETPLRNYDPQLGRFHGVDVLASEFASLSPYQYAFNNPMLFSDPTGAKPVAIQDAEAAHQGGGGGGGWSDVADLIGRPNMSWNSGGSG